MHNSKKNTTFAPNLAYMLRKIHTILLLLLLATVVKAQEPELSVVERNAAQGFNDTIDRTAEDFVTVSLVVCDPGDVLYSALGHAALHLQCPVFDLDYVFSYESESIRDKIWKFLKGDLKMGMYAFPTDLFLDIYRCSGRGVKEYKLNLSPSQEQKLWEVMDNMVAQGANLPYDYFHRGCAKSVVHVIHRALGQNAIEYAPWSDKYTSQTMRELATSFATNVSWIEFVSYFLVGIEGDREYACERKLIVPTDLVEVWQQASFANGKPVLDTEPHVLLEPTCYNEDTWCTPLLVSLLLLLLAFIPSKTVDYALLALYTAVGVVMSYLILFSTLPCTSWNWLIIPFNILPAIFWYWRRYWALPYAGIIFIWCLFMIGEYLWGHVLVDWPHILLALSFAVILFKQRFSRTPNL